MANYIQQTFIKGRLAESRADEVFKERVVDSPRPAGGELRHGAWIEKVRASRRAQRLRNPLFALAAVFAFLFTGSLFLFENMEVATAPMYAVKITVSSLFAVSLGFILSVWWNSAAKFDEKLREAARIDTEYRELLMSFSDGLFDIINALNTLAHKPPRPFVIATEFLLGEYVHLLQSQLQRYGDYIAGLGLDATHFLDEKIRIFEGIRERASVSIEGMPRDVAMVFVDSLKLHGTRPSDAKALRQRRIREQLKELEDRPEGTGRGHAAEKKTASMPLSS